MATYSYSFDDSGPYPFFTWMPSTVLPEGGYRVQAPGTLDPNHLDGIGALRLVSHLSLPSAGGPGVLDLRNATVSITIKSHDFDAHGAKLVWWVCSFLPPGAQSDWPNGNVI